MTHNENNSQNKQNNLFKAMLDVKIEDFVNSFDRADVFYSKETGIINTGEYGGYREKCLKQLLRLCFGKRYSIGDGYIINAKNERSTQTDIIIYDANNIGAITLDDKLNYYPIEMVYGIGEVKSLVKYSELKEILVKLAKQKMLAKNMTNTNLSDFQKAMKNNYPFSFLVCKKIIGMKKIDDEYWEKYMEIFRLSLDIIVF